MNNSKKIIITLTPKTVNRLSNMCSKMDLSRSELVRRALDNFFITDFKEFTNLLDTN